MTMTSNPHPLLTVGQTLRFKRPMVSFFSKGDRRRTTDLGPLIPRGAAVSYVGPYAGRPGVHVAATVNDEVPFEVPFKVDDLA
jgi:hypothetical protein